MDEPNITPILAEKKQKGKLNWAYFWPIYGEEDEVCFSFSNHRTMDRLEAQLGNYRGTLLTEGCGVYKQYQKHPPETNAVHLSI